VTVDTVTDPSTQSASGKPSPDSVQLGLGRQLAATTRAIFSSPVGKTLWMLVAGIVVVILATAYGQICLNRWNKPFFDALSRRDLHDFFYELGVFGIIAGCLLVLNVVQRWLSETLQWKLREGSGP
jgi:putative ATP-binding cassette transporter